MKKFFIVFLGVIVLFAFWFVSARNHLVSLEEGINSQWSQVENVYQRRLDLIPNLVNTVKGYAAHERETLEAVIQARTAATQGAGEGNVPNVTEDPQAFQKFQQSQGALSSALSRLMVVVERYPDLKANQSFLELQSQLEGTENRITVERKRFNEVAKDYNVAIREFPSSLVAGLSGFHAKNYFQADEGARKAPEVKF